MEITFFASFCAYLVKGLCGFANTLIFDAILSFWQDNIEITPIDAPLSFISNLIVAWHEHRSVSFTIWGRAAAYMIMGIIPGVFFLQTEKPGTIKLILGGLILFLAIGMMRNRKKENTGSTPIANMILGISAGFFSGLLGIGALISLYMARVTSNLEAFRGNLAILFIVTNGFRLILYYHLGIMNAATLRVSALLLPAMILGVGCGLKLSRHLDEGLVRKVIIAFMMLSGLSLIILNF
jgi:uncharacterized membrane protein YfcA